MSDSRSSPLEKTKKRRQKRFAPLDPNVKHGYDLPKLRGIVFDVDGTLCLPQNYMFKEMRSALNIDKPTDILDHIRSLSTDPDTATGSSPRSRAVNAIEDIERRAMKSQRPQPGLQQLMSYLNSRGMRKALCTRNFEMPVHHLLETFLPDEAEYGRFDPIIHRDSDGVQPKPSPDGIWKIAREWGMDRDGDSPLARSEALVDGQDVEHGPKVECGLIMVGDSIDDMEAGYRAGAATVLLANRENEHLVEHDFTGRSVRRLDELIGLLEDGFEEEN